MTIVPSGFKAISISDPKFLVKTVNMSFKTCTLLFMLLQAGVSPARCDDTVDRSNFTVALVRTPPPNWPLPITNYNYSGISFNISECVDAGVALIQSAAETGSNLIVFPELWFPG